MNIQSPQMRAKAAETIILPKNKNLTTVITWLREIGLDVPDFPERRLHSA